MKDAIRLHRSKEGKTYASVFVHEGCKRVVKKKDKKTQTIVTQARAREIVFNLGAERAEREVPRLQAGDESEPSPSLRSNFKQ